MTQPPILTGQHIGQAHYATRAVLEASLAETGTPFVSWIAVNLVATNGPVVDRTTVVAGLVGGLKLDQRAADDALDAVISTGLVAPTIDDSSRVELTASGEALFRKVSAAASAIVDRLYGGIAPEELETARRVLVTVTERANAELASAAAS
jgi:DNA-binding MarR family transcriptional regulator